MCIYIYIYIFVTPAPAARPRAGPGGAVPTRLGGSCEGLAYNIYIYIYIITYKLCII